jgi:hypothetical protein
MNKWLISILAGLAGAGLAFLLYNNNRHKAKLYNVHYVLGSSTGANIPGEIPFMIQKRIDQLGYTPMIRLIGNSKLDIRVEHVKDTIALRKSVIQDAEFRKIEFREIYTLDELPDLYSTANIISKRIYTSLKRKEVGIYSIMSPLIPDEVNGQNIYPAAIGSVNKNDTVTLNRFLKDPGLLKALPPDIRFYYGRLTSDIQILNTPNDLHLYAIRTGGQPALLQNENIETAEFVEAAGIRIKFDNAGRTRWAKMTGDNIGRYLAVILDDMVLLAPYVADQLTGSYVTLYGKFTADEMFNLPQQLTAGKTAARLAITKQEITRENEDKVGYLVLILALAFAFISGVTFLCLNSLKNN